MLVNASDGAVVVDEADRTVLLTEKQTIVIDKVPRIEITPSNRPRKVYGGMWGPAEIGAVGGASLAILGVIAFYFFAVVPANRELVRNKSERDRIESEVTSAREKYGNITSTETQVAKLLSSVDDFESQFLPVASNGRTALYQRINGLIMSYGLINTSGPDYAPLDIAEKGDANQPDEERGRSKFRSLFPGAYVTMTLEGSYQNLRRFIREIETGREFVIVSAVELEPSDNLAKPDNQSQQQQPGSLINQAAGDFNSFQNLPNQPQPNALQPARPKGKTIGENVSLRMEMAAYFRRVSPANFSVPGSVSPN